MSRDYNRERYSYQGEIVASDFVDEHNFKSYKLSLPQPVGPSKLFDMKSVMENPGRWTR